MCLRLRVFVASAVVSTSLWLLAPCRAGVVFTLGNNPQPGEENVLFDASQTGTSVFGTTNQSHPGVRFTSTQTLSVDSSGQAAVGAINPSTQAAVPVTAVTFSVPGGSFTDAIMNPFIGGQPPVDTGTPATVTVLTDEHGGGTATATFTYPTSGPGAWGNGSNFLTIVATGGETIASVTVDAPGGFDDLRQVRLSGAALTVVPEPAGLTLAALGGLCLAWRARRSKV